MPNAKGFSEEVGEYGSLPLVRLSGGIILHSPVTEEDTESCLVFHKSLSRQREGGRTMNSSIEIIDEMTDRVERPQPWHSLSHHNYMSNVPAAELLLPIYFSTPTTVNCSELQALCSALEIMPVYKQGSNESIV